MKCLLAMLAGSVLVALSNPAMAQIGGSECEDSYRSRAWGGTLKGVDGEDQGQIDGSIVVVGSLNNPSSDCTVAKQELPNLDAYGATGRIEQSFNAIPGLQQFRRSDSRSANPTSQGITLRGLGGNASSRALVFVDDVPQADPFGGWVSWPGYDALNLRGVKVSKGGGHVSAGPGALAGVIEMESVQSKLESRRDMERSVTLGYGSRNSVEARGRFRSYLGQGEVILGGSYARGDGFVPVVKNQRGAVDRAAPYEQAGLALRVVTDATSNIELQANMRAFTDKRDRGVNFSANKNSGVDASFRLKSGWADWMWSATAYLQIRDFSSQFGAVSADRSTVTPTLDQFETPSTGLGLRFEVRPPLGDNAELRLGGEWRRAIGETKENFNFVAGAPTRLRTAGGKSDSYGAFVELNVKPIDGMTLSAGGRLDRWQIKEGFRREVNIGGAVRSDDRFVDRSETEETARFGAAYNFTDDWLIKASAYTAWRLPTLNELYRPFRLGSDATAANEALRPERIKGVEAGLSYNPGSYPSGATTHGNLTLFYNHLDNAIANVTLGPGAGNFPGVGFVAAGGVYRQRQNLAAIVSKGIELDGRIELVDGLGLVFGYAYVDAKVKARGVALALDGLRPAQVPRHFVNAGFDYREDQGPWRAAFNLRYLGRQFDDDANTRAMKEALTADIMVYYEFADDWGLELRAENVFNARIEAGISSNGIVERASPQTIWLGLRAKLQ